MTEKPARYILAAVMIVVVLRAGATVDGFRSMFFGAAWFLGAVCAVSIALNVCELTALSVAKKWQDRQFDACGLLHADGQPCHLPDGHVDNEHATEWKPGAPPTIADGVLLEVRYRFDDTGDRREYRVARGLLPKVTRGGDVVTPAPVK